MTAEELFLSKYGNKITASESWVIRFAEEYAEIVLDEFTKADDPNLVFKPQSEINPKPQPQPN